MRELIPSSIFHNRDDNSNLFYVLALDGGIREVRCHRVTHIVFENDTDYKLFKKAYPSSHIIEVENCNPEFTEDGKLKRRFACNVYTHRFYDGSMVTSCESYNSAVQHDSERMELQKLLKEKYEMIAKLKRLQVLEEKYTQGGTK